MSDDDSRTVRINRLKGESGMTSHASREPNKIIVRFLSVLEEVMTKYAHSPLFQLISLGGKLRVVFEIVLFWFTHSPLIRLRQPRWLYEHALLYLWFYGASVQSLETISTADRLVAREVPTRMSRYPLSCTTCDSREIQHPKP
jgi:hypothetical protein